MSFTVEQREEERGREREGLTLPTLSGALRRITITESDSWMLYSLRDIEFASIIPNERRTLNQEYYNDK